jgi:hypothetical protein
MAGLDRASKLECIGPDPFLHLSYTRLLVRLDLRFSWWQVEA